MKATCTKCRQAYVLAVLGDLMVWMAVAPWAKGMCSACDLK